MAKAYSILVVAAFLTGCAATPHQPIGKNAKDNPLVVPTVSTTPVEREPLPLFHPEYQTDPNRHHFDEHTESNLRTFSKLVKRTVSVEIGLWNFGWEEVDYTYFQYADPQLIADIRWAFSGNLMETRIPGFSAYGTRFVFHLDNGETVVLRDAGSFYEATFEKMTYSLIRVTPEMEKVLKPYYELAKASR
ncbi:hypothetical protein OAU50_03350 [Planctomycetota bacterium]|nr:hypothetical protein [Planctomycetota bacterium]